MIFRTVESPGESARHGEAGGEQTANRADRITPATTGRRTEALAMILHSLFARDGGRNLMLHLIIFNPLRHRPNLFGVSTSLALLAAPAGEDGATQRRRDAERQRRENGRPCRLWSLRTKSRARRLDGLGRVFVPCEGAYSSLIASTGQVSTQTPHSMQVS